MNYRRNVLIFHQAALGDFIVTWPVAVALARMYPQSRIVYVTPAGKGALAEKVLGVESAEIESGWHALHADAGSAGLNARNQKLLAGAHTVVSFVSDGSDLWAQNVRRLAPEAALVPLNTKPSTPPPSAGSADLPEPLHGHVTELLLDQLSPWPALREATRQILRSITERGLACRRAPGGSAVIHPGAGSPTKCWPVERFVELARRLRAAGQPVRVLLGEAELEKWPGGAIELVERSATVRRPGTFIELLQELLTAGVFIGNDSGPGHLAGIIGVPTIALFGTDPCRWKPLGPRVSVICGQSLEEIDVDQVFSAIQVRDNGQT